MGLLGHKAEYILEVGYLHLGYYHILFYRCNKGRKKSKPTLREPSGYCWDLFKVLFYWRYLQNNEK